MTEERLPVDALGGFSMDAGVADLGGDGDLDDVTANADVNLAAGRIADAPFRAYRNDGAGVFTEATSGIFPASGVGTGFDAELHDFDGDGVGDLYLASRGTVDRLRLGRR